MRILTYSTCCVLLGHLILIPYITELGKDILLWVQSRTIAHIGPFESQFVVLFPLVNRKIDDAHLRITPLVRTEHGVALANNQVGPA